MDNGPVNHFLQAHLWEPYTSSGKRSARARVDESLSIFHWQSLKNIKNMMKLRLH